MECFLTWILCQCTISNELQLGITLLSSHSLSPQLLFCVAMAMGTTHYPGGTAETPVNKALHAVFSGFGYSTKREILLVTARHCSISACLSCAAVGILENFMHGRLCSMLFVENEVKCCAKWHCAKVDAVSLCFQVCTAQVTLCQTAMADL